MSSQPPPQKTVPKYVVESLDEQLKRLLANPTDELAFDHPQWPKPRVGDKVEIVSWDTQINVQECVRVSRLPHVTVKEVHPMLVGNGITSYWSYTIEVEESKLVFLQWHYKIINY